MNVKYKIFRSTFQTWEQMAQNATIFASKLKDDRLINISHSVDKDNEGTVIVWYYE